LQWIRIRWGAKVNGLWKNADLEVWAKQLRDGSRAVILLNRGSVEAEISANWEDLGYPSRVNASVRDLWQHKDLGKFHGEVFRARDFARRRNGDRKTLALSAVTLLPS